MTIYCISGLGADERAFGKLTINDAELVPLPWLLPEKNETIAHYAARMIENIKEPNPILMGLSFGGIMSIEIAKQIPVKAVILVSSVKSTAELPAWMKWIAATRINKIFPVKSTRLMEPITNRTLGVMNEDELTLARDFRKNSPAVFNTWAVDKVLNWKNKELPARIFHIHGTKDRMFPVKKIHPTHVIDGGRHFMIMTKAAEVSDAVNSILLSLGER